MNRALGRLADLVDPHSLQIVEMNRSAVILAAGKIAGRPVVLFAFNEAKYGGAFGYFEGATISRALHIAEEAEAPLVGLFCTAGANLRQGQLALRAYGDLFMRYHRSTVLKIYLSYGACAGGGAYLAGLSDIVLGIRDVSKLFLTGPVVVRRAIFEEADAQALGGTEVVNRYGGFHYIEPSAADMAKRCKDLIAFFCEKRRPATQAAELDILPYVYEEIVDIDRILASIFDGGRYSELWKDWGRNAVCAWGYVGGKRVGVFANRPIEKGGVLDRTAAEKAAAFYRLSARIPVPVLSLVDTPGFLPGTESERSGVLKAGAEMLKAYMGHPEKKLTVAVGKVFGGAYMAMGAKEMGACRYYALSRAQIGIMGASYAASLLDFDETQREFYRLRHLSAHSAAASGMIDAVIAPAEIRNAVIKTL